jgi:hypothetical protein
MAAASARHAAATSAARAAMGREARRRITRGADTNRRRKRSSSREGAAPAVDGGYQSRSKRGSDPLCIRCVCARTVLVGAAATRAGGTPKRAPAAVCGSRPTIDDDIAGKHATQRSLFHNLLTTVSLDADSFRWSLVDDRRVELRRDRAAAGERARPRSLGRAARDTLLTATTRRPSPWCAAPPTRHVRHAVLRVPRPLDRGRTSASSTTTPRVVCPSPSPSQGGFGSKLTPQEQMKQVRMATGRSSGHAG